MKQTSINTYENEIEPDLGRRQLIVLVALLKRGVPASDKELSEFLDNPINSVTPRRNELVDDALVEESERAPCDVTGRRVIKWTFTTMGKEIAKDWQDKFEELREDEV